MSEDENDDEGVSRRKTDEYILETIAKATGNDKLLREFRRNSRAFLEIETTEDGSLHVRLIKPRDLFSAMLMWFLIFGVCQFTLIGWILSFAFEWAFGPIANAQILFIIRSVLFGITVCIHTWNDDDELNQLAPGKQAILIALILLVSLSGLIFEFWNGDTWGLVWSTAMIWIIIRGIFED